MNWKWKCPVCGKEFENPTILDFCKFPKIAMYGNFKVKDKCKDSRELIEVDMKVKPVCSKECVEYYKDKFFVEVYKGKQIYYIAWKYIPYWGCDYYFKTIDDVRNCIDAGVNQYILMRKFAK